MSAISAANAGQDSQTVDQIAGAELQSSAASEVLLVGGWRCSAGRQAGQHWCMGQPPLLSLSLSTATNDWWASTCWQHLGRSALEGGWQE